MPPPLPLTNLFPSFFFWQYFSLSTQMYIIFLLSPHLHESYIFFSALCRLFQCFYPSACYLLGRGRAIHTSCRISPLFLKGQVVVLANENTSEIIYLPVLSSLICGWLRVFCTLSTTFFSLSHARFLLEIIILFTLLFFFFAAMFVLYL